MAKKEESKIVLERTYNVPLRRTWLYTPRYRRAKRAVNALREFMARHMKAEFENIKVGKYANLEIWKNGIKNPPHHIKVDAKKDDKGIVTVEIVGAPKEIKKETKPSKPVKPHDDHDHPGHKHDEPVEAEFKETVPQEKKPEPKVKKAAPKKVKPEQ